MEEVAGESMLLWPVKLWTFRMIAKRFSSYLVRASATDKVLWWKDAFSFIVEKVQRQIEHGEATV